MNHVMISLQIHIRFLRGQVVEKSTVPVKTAEAIEKVCCPVNASSIYTAVPCKNLGL